MIDVSNLRMVYQVKIRDEGVKGAIKGLVIRKTKETEALKNVSFNIPTGKMVGIIGPNGAGKTTLLKILSGVICPTSGDVNVLGYRPFDHKRNFKKKISLIMGQRNQLLWDIPAIESFKVIQAIYEIDQQRYRIVLEELLSMLDMEKHRNTPVRQLSLGERTKMNIIAGLLYSPELLFLDEPTIGLDIKSQLSIRKFLKQYSENNKTTILLTSHYMADIEETCRDIFIIDYGKILFNDDISKLKHIQSQYKYVSYSSSEDNKTDIIELVRDVQTSDDKVTIKIDQTNLNKVIEILIKDRTVSNITVEDMPIETVILELLENESTAQI